MVDKRPASSAKIEANKANAQKSTGPVELQFVARLA